MVAERIRTLELSAELTRYRGQWVALKEGQVVASNPDAAALVAELRTKGIERAALHRVPEEPKATYVL